MSTGKAETIAPRLPEAATVRDLEHIIYEEFVRWFDVDTAGPIGRYSSIAREAWPIWLTRH